MVIARAPRESSLGWEWHVIASTPFLCSMQVTVQDQIRDMMKEALPLEGRNSKSLQMAWIYKVNNWGHCWKATMQRHMIYETKNSSKKGKNG